MMICRSCKTKIDYLFLSNCSECGAEVDAGSFPLTLNGPDDFPSENAEEKSFTWKHHLANLAYVLATSLVGMVSGAVVLYFGAAVIFLAFFNAGGTASDRCARGMAVGFFSILSGAYLGTVVGSIFAVKHLIFKRPAV